MMAIERTDTSSWGIIGHRHQVESLMRYARSGQFPTAMLLTGTPGVGRLALVQALAKATFCPERAPGVFCGQCSSCTLVDHGTHPDLQIWSIARQDAELSQSAGGHLLIDTVRAIGTTAVLRPQRADHRFIVIDDAETLQSDQQQAMLKMLEDVPPFLTFILLSSSSAVMLDTVLSRCIEFPLQLVGTSIIRSALTSNHADEIAALAHGRPGWALAAQADESVLIAERDSVTALETWISLPRRDRLVEAYRRGDRTLKGDRLPARREEIADIVRLQRLWRDLVMTTAQVQSAVFDTRRSEELRSRWNIDTRSAHSALVATITCHDDFLRNVRPRLALQTMVNQWPIL